MKKIVPCNDSGHYYYNRDFQSYFMKTTREYHIMTVKTEFKYNIKNTRSGESK